MKRSTFLGLIVAPFIAPLLPKRDVEAYHPTGALGDMTEPIEPDKFKFYVIDYDYAELMDGYYPTKAIKLKEFDMKEFDGFLKSKDPKILKI